MLLNQYKKVEAQQVIRKLTGSAKEAFNKLNKLNPIWVMKEPDYEGDLHYLLPAIKVKTSKDSDIIHSVSIGFATSFNEAVSAFYYNLKGELEADKKVVVVNAFMNDRREYEYNGENLVSGKARIKI